MSQHSALARYPQNEMHIFASGRTRVARSEWGGNGGGRPPPNRASGLRGRNPGPFVGGNRASGPAWPTHAPRPMVRPVQPPAKTAPAASANRLETRCRAQAPGRRPCSIARPPSVPSGSRTISRSRIGPSLAHPLLGSHLRHDVRLMTSHRAKSALEILGSPDDLKFRSCLTLFAEATSEDSDGELFKQALEQFYGGEPDRRTMELLRSTKSA